MSNGSLPAIVAFGRHGRGGVGSRADAEIAPAHEPFGLDGGDRVGPHQLMQVLGDLELHPELPARRVRREDLRDGSRLGAGHPHDRAGLKPGDLLELGVDRELLREGHLPIADHEQADREQERGRPARTRRRPPVAPVSPLAASL